MIWDAEHLVNKSRLFYGSFLKYNTIMPFEYFINGDYIHLNNLKCGLDPHIT